MAASIRHVTREGHFHMSITCFVASTSDNAKLILLLISAITLWALKTRTGQFSQ